MILEDIHELSMLGVYDRGIPNKERIVFRANSDVELGGFFIFLGASNASGEGAIPLFNRAAWLGDAFLAEGDWLLIYTGAGEPSVVASPEGEGQFVHTGFWSFKNVVFRDPRVVPILIRADAILVGKSAVGYGSNIGESNVS